MKLSAALHFRSKMVYVPEHGTGAYSPFGTCHGIHGSPCLCAWRSRSGVYESCQTRGSDDGACVGHEFVFHSPPHFRVFIPLMFGSFYRLVRGAVSSEHIKYPDSSKASQQTVANGTNNTRKTSVTATNPQVTRPGTGSLQPEPGFQSGSPVQPSSDSEALRRTMSPTNAPKTNDVQPAQYTTAEKGKAPMRPKREDEDSDVSEVNGAPERAISPEQRARSPTYAVTGGASRTVSPVQRPGFGDDQPPSMTSLVFPASKDGGSGLAARSVSPPVDRSKPPVDAFYTSGRGSSPGTVTSQPNGHIHNSPSPSASGVEDTKKREAWLKAALIRASRSGFVYADAQDPPEDLVLDFANADQGETKRVVEMIMNLKHMRAAIQVRSLLFLRSFAPFRDIN